MNLPNLQQIMAWFYKKGHLHSPLRSLHKAMCDCQEQRGAHPAHGGCEYPACPMSDLPRKQKILRKLWGKLRNTPWSAAGTVECCVILCHQGYRPVSVWLLMVQHWGLGKVPLVQVQHVFYEITPASKSFLFKQKLHVNKQLDSYVLFKIKAIFRSAASRCPWHWREARQR